MSLKEKILERLSLEGEYVSGQQLADENSVSRAAVWKAVKSLKEDGFEIASVSNKGYRLLKTADTLYCDKIRSLLKRNAERLEVIVLDTVDSTNNEAKRMLATGDCADHLIIANEQTNGRGRLGRSFYSPKNTGIYMTLLMQSRLPLSDAVTVTTAAAVAVVKAIENVTGIVSEIKWVNDVYVNGKKVCGILTEAISDFETGTAKSIIIGIGINITTEHFPDDIQDRAASLRANVPVRNNIIAETANQLVSIYDNLPDKTSFISCYREHSLVIGKKIDFYINNIKQTGIARDIDDNGGLIVSLSDGSCITLSSGEVTVRLADSMN